MIVMVWINDDARWDRAIAVARERLVPGDEVVLLHVTAAGDEHLARGAFAGLLGRGGADPGDAVARVADDRAATVLDEAERLLGRAARRVRRSGHTEHEVVDAAREADLLVLVRDGDPSRPGPHSVGHRTRFVVDHAPCAVLLVWPERPPADAPAPPPEV